MCVGIDKAHVSIKINQEGAIRREDAVGCGASSCPDGNALVSASTFRLGGPLRIFSTDRDVFHVRLVSILVLSQLRRHRYVWRCEMMEGKEGEDVEEEEEEEETDVSKGKGRRRGLGSRF